MNPYLLDSGLKPYLIRLGELVKDLHQLVIETRNEALATTVSELRNTLSEPFLFVIVGEVKAGKSSFINALLGEGEVCKVAPDPCTDTIQQLLYGEKPETVIVNPYLRKIFQPAEILRHISVVDTPGTNTVEAHHQEITERFVPRSDLVVFVFEAKNPYRQSAWDFFDYIHRDWQKKIIFILQQADLMSREDLQVNINGLIRHAEKKGMNAPQVFPVSAKYELEGKTEESGFVPLNIWLKEHITGRNAWLLKLRSSLSTSMGIHGKTRLDLDRLQQQLKSDLSFREDILHTLRDQEERSVQMADALTGHMINDYDRVTQKALRDLSDGLGFFSLARKSVASVFSKSDSPQAWLQNLMHQLERDLNHSFTLNLTEGVETIADSITQMARIIDLKIQTSQSILKPQQDIFGDISDRRRSVLRDMQESFGRFMTQTEQFAGTDIFPQAAGFSPNLAAGSGMAVIGAVLAAVTQITALDITGGILSAAGILFAGGTVLFKRGKIISGFESEIGRGRDRIRQELDLRLKSYINHIRLKIDKNFEPFDALLQSEQKHAEKMEQQFSGIALRSEELSRELEAME